MAKLSKGARQLPLQHLSVRVPWHDGGWNGTVCLNPKANNTCLALPRISETRDDQAEEARRGQSWHDLAPVDLPACQAERAAFMAPFDLTRYLNHPYATRSKAHAHFAQTPFRHPRYSANCIPFGWMLKDRAAEHVERLALGFEQALEDEVHREMEYETNWVQSKDNQLALLDTFFGALEPQRSLCIFYAKDTPLAEDPRRVIIGVGRVSHVGEAVEYCYSRPGRHRAVLWDTVVQHSIRPKTSDSEGFLFPYYDLLDLAGRDSSFDLGACVAFAPDEIRPEFSYAAEHVTHDSAVAALLACAEALRQIGDRVPGDWERAAAWIDSELNRLWKLRGPFPGLGSALKALGIPGGALIAYDIALAQQGAGEEWREDPWVLIDQAMKDPSLLSASVRHYLTPTWRAVYSKLTPERRALLQLVSRFTLTEEQATRFYVPEERKDAGIDVTDATILANPYLLYELDRSQPDPVAVTTVDRGVFPEKLVAARFPVPETSAADGPVDGRRVRALVVNELERAAADGHTLMPRDAAVLAVRRSGLQPPCEVSIDVLAVVEGGFTPMVVTVEMADGSPAYQVERLRDAGAVIRSTVERRRTGQRFKSDADWARVVDAILPAPAALQSDEDARLEVKARKEKAAALAELFGARLSVLTGSAGTGKTTLLRALCNLPDIKQKGVLLLAPTGKARVRMETQIQTTGAQTIAQFLIPSGRYDPQTGRYRLAPGRAKTGGYGTVIIDESSMLTEEQLAAVIDALESPSRLILVGDAKQLPPIGSGRPFVDIVRRLAPADVETRFPRIGPGFAELTIQRRHLGATRLDLQLAEWFTGRDPGVGADEVWDRLAAGGGEHVESIRWQREDQLHDQLLAQLINELNLSGPEDENGFEQSIGGNLFQGAVYFRNKYKDHPGAAASAENWQVLSPVRSGQAGVEALNRFIQTTFRRRVRQWAEESKPWLRKVPKPLGRLGILYGDKVICVTNKRREKVWPKQVDGRDALEYVANGEIGIAVGEYKGQKSHLKSAKHLEVEFSSQSGFKYTFWRGEFGEEGDQPLELAYALTVHKTQGSEFGTTFLILPSPCRLLSPELLYTALTRQKQKIIIFHQGDLAELRKYSRTYFSETARRLTNLLAPPAPVSLDDRFLELGLIHRTRRGEAVRSKSEVVIADLLHSLDISYVYEKELVGADGSRRWPDFTVDDAETGLTVYWEHLGMLDDEVYRDRWKRKLEWYARLGVAKDGAETAKNGILVTSQDGPDGSINSGEIERIARRVFGKQRHV